MKQDILQSRTADARCFGHTMHRLGVHCRTRARGVVDYLQTTAPLYQQSVAIREEGNTERVHHIPGDHGDAELVLFGGVERVRTGSKFDLRDSRLGYLRLLRDCGERQDCDQ
jgi:hypothetical protein